MPVRRIRRRLSMTSLIDVIFLLLLFFMLSSTFAKFGEVDLVAGGSGLRSVGGKQQTPVFVQVRQDAVTVNGTSTTLTNLVDTAKAYQGKETTRFLVSLRPGATSETLVQVIHNLRRIPDAKILVVNR